MNLRHLVTRGCLLPGSGCAWLALAAPALAQGGNAPQPKPQQEAPAGFLEIMFSGGIFGIILMLALIALSLTAAYLVFEHIMTLRKSELMPTGLADRVRKSVTVGKFEEAEQACRAQPSFLAFVLLNGIAEVEGGWSAVEKALEDAVAEQSARLFRKIEYLSVIGNIAPMLGLLGTVTGMIMAFREVAVSSGSAGAGELAAGIYQALVTTVAGLVIAIPALGAFAIFRNRVDQLVAEAAYLAQHALAPLKRKKAPGKWKEPGASSAAPAPPPPPVEGVR
jgi:biopolymer transport protein ExbB